MKKILRTVFVLIVIMLTYCAKDTFNNSNTNGSITNDGFEDEIQWISLTYIGNEDAKNDVRNALEDEFHYIKKDYEFENKIFDAKSIPVAIAYHDFNHDYKDEIIAFVSHGYLCGASSSGALYIIMYNEDSVVSAKIAGFALDTLTIDDPNTKQVGIKYNKDGWDELFVNNRFWRTNLFK